MTLEEWQRNRWLKQEQSSAEEIADLLELVERNLHDAGIESVSLDGRLQFAFNAALICATIGLRAEGYRIPAIEGHHEKTLNSLKFTLECNPGLIAKLNGFRKKRSNIIYDMAGTTSKSQLDNLLELVDELYRIMKKWLREKHSELL